MYYSFPKSENTINNFTIFGERCSGTKFLEKYFQSYTQLPTTWEFGWKHFFGHSDRKIIQQGDNTLFLCIVRDPYQWLMSFNNRRHHIKGGKKKTDFFTGEWYSVRTDKISYTPEIKEDRNPINGQRYKNIFEMRKYKCKYLWYELPLYAKNNYFIRYEDLLSYGLYVVKDICNIFDLPIITKRNQPIEQPTKGRHHPVSDELLTLFNNNIDWSTENTIGYLKKDRV